MERYETNGFCEYLKQYQKPHTFRFYDTTKSLLVVAKKQDNEPMMLIIDDRIPKKDLSNELDAYEKDFGNICYHMSKVSGLPLFWLRYADREILTNEDWVTLWESGHRMDFRPIQMKDLVSVFRSYNIEAKLENRTPQKQKNDSFSSAFHIWQRECLRVGVFADIDLIRLDKTRTHVASIIELKRSHYSLEQWRPFAFDLNNFSIISNFCRKLGNIPFYILYHEQIPRKSAAIEEPNRRFYFPTQKKGVPYFDKVDRLKIFQVEQREHVYFYSLPYPVCRGIYRIDDWIERETDDPMDGE